MKVEDLPRPEKQWLLVKYSEWLEKHGYLDSDWREEYPYAADEFLDEEGEDCATATLQETNSVLTKQVVTMTKALQEISEVAQDALD